MNYSDCLLAMGDKRMRATRVPSIRAGAGHRLVHGKRITAMRMRHSHAGTEPGKPIRKKAPETPSAFQELVEGGRR